MTRRARRHATRRAEAAEDPRELAAFALGHLVADPNSTVSREIRRDLAYSLQDDEPLLRALVSHTQAMRDAGGLDRDEAHYLIGFFTEGFTFHYAETDRELVDLTSQMRVIEAQHGLPEDSGGFMLSEAPPEWLALSRRWDHRLDLRWSALLRDLGEPEMAAMMGLPAHEERWEAGARSLGVRAFDAADDQGA